MDGVETLIVKFFLPPLLLVIKFLFILFGLLPKGTSSKKTKISTLSIDSKYPSHGKKFG